MPTSIYTQNLEFEVPVRSGTAQANPEEDVAKIAVFERHKASGNVAVGFIKGLGIREGAVGSTIGHDSHNLVVAGMNDHDMIIASNLLIQSEGGMVVVRNQRSMAHVPLPIAGLMSEKPLEKVAKQIEDLKNAWSSLGSSLPSPIVTLAFTTLPVIPELRITDRGLLDTLRFKFLSPIIG
jgi:adenine deaminase